MILINNTKIIYKNNKNRLLILECEDTGCCPEDLPEAMNDRETWKERVRDIRATSTT